MATAAPRTAYRAGRWQAGNRSLPDEAAVALVMNGTTQAVMMATPDDLEDFALGFALTEGIAQAPAEITGIEVVQQEDGHEARVWLCAAATERLASRRRAQVGPVGCGLCGIDSLAGAMRDLPPLAAGGTLHPAGIGLAMAALADGQRLRRETGAIHAAGFWVPGRGLVALREDVGRHNALDKLAGAILRAGEDPAAGAIAITSRVSVDLVQKAATLGTPILIAASVPTALSVARAEDCGLTLVGSARGPDFDLYTHPERIQPEPASDVA